MKRSLIVCFFLLLLTNAALLSVQAQEAPIDPAAYTPARATRYVEMRSDESGIEALDALSETAAGEGSETLIDSMVAPRIRQRLPDVDFRADILPWLGERFAMSAATAQAATELDDFVFVLPIGDAAGAQAFVERVASGAAPEDRGGVQVYTIGSSKLAVSDTVVWLGAGTTIDSLFSFALENLSQNAAYQQIRAALPADAPVTLYVSGSFVASEVDSIFGMPTSDPSLATLWQTALRLHPAQSDAEDALWALPPLKGIGLAAQSSATQADFILALSVNAQYPAPTLPSASAGSALLDMLPTESTVVFTSYDLGVPLLAGAGVAALTTPVVGETFSTIINTLDTSAATPTPPPTPGPVTAETLLAELQPALRQIESTMGMTLADLYPLINGEYAFVQFPNGEGSGQALYLQSANPQHLIETLERVSHLVLANPDPLEQIFTVEQTTIGNTAVTLVSSPYLSERLALGILPGNVLFVTQESSATLVLDAAAAAASSPHTAARDAYGTAQEAFFFLSGNDLQALSALIIGSGVPAPFSSLAGALDVRENGLFVLRLSAVTE
jgi:hypothetical protein